MAFSPHLHAASELLSAVVPQSPTSILLKALWWSGYCSCNAIHDHGSSTSKGTSSEREGHL